MAVAEDPSSLAGCLAEADLTRLLASRDTAPESVLAHLEACPKCRSRLETLAGRDSLPADGWSDMPRSSDVLTHVMHRLRAEPPSREPSEPRDVGGDSVDHLLDPPAGRGYLGRFAGYDVLERVASGGMGIVLKAYDGALQRVVAIKVLAPALAVSEAARARFLREARAAAAVNHEHVVAIHAVGECKGVPYLVMRFVEGRSLQARLDAEGTLELTEILRIGIQAAQGLAAAHSQGLIHRDVKPGNILLENSIERVKLTDFGLARAADSPGLTRTGVVAGTPEFMAPEQARGERLDTRADLFSLGCVLYVMSTGVSPFQADSTPATLRKVCDDEPPPVHVVNPALPAWFAAIVSRLMAKEPARRLGEASDVARLLMLALAQLQTGRSPAEVVLPIGEIRHAPPVPGRRDIHVALAAAVLGLIALTVWLRTVPRNAGDGFRVIRAEGGGILATSLVSALAAAGPEDIIELDWDGRREIEPVEIHARTVTLRAGSGRHPVVVHPSQTRPWMTTDGPLTMEGIEVRAARADSDLAPVGRPGTSTRRFGEPRRGQADLALAFEPKDALLVVRGAPLKLVNCRLVASSLMEPGRQPVLLLDSPKGDFVNCAFFHQGGAAVGWRIEPREAPSEPSLRWTNCIVMARAALVASFAGEGEARLEIRASTFLGTFFAGFEDRPGTLTTAATDSVFSVRRPMASVVTAVRYRWLGEGNVYSRNGSEAVFPVPVADRGSMSLSLNLADRIRAQAGTGRGLTAADFALSAEEVARIGRAVGADPKGVGP